MAKVKRYDGEEGSLITEKRVPIPRPAIEDESDRGEMTEGQKANNYATRQMEIEDESDRGVMQTAKPKIVTKEQMKAAGYDNLRDYLNATNPGGPLKRRDGSAPSKPAPAPKAEPKPAPKSEPVSVTKEKTTVASPSSAKDETTTKKTYRGIDGKMHTIEAKKEDSSSGFLGKSFREAMGSKYKKGGMASASKRADGKITKGHTNCKIR
jgi:hypothetical protein